MSEEKIVAEPDVESSDPVKKITRIALIVIAIVFIWYVIADRLAPWTDQARVQAYIVPIVSQVAGRVIEVNVGKDQEVQQGDVLLKIDPSDYLLAVENAETALELAGQDIGAGTASVATAQSKVVEAQANVTHYKAQGKRVFELEKKQIYSVAQGDKARAAIIKADAQLASARSELENYSGDGQRPHYGQNRPTPGPTQIDQHEGRIAAGNQHIDGRMIKLLQFALETGTADRVINCRTCVEKYQRQTKDHGADPVPAITVYKGPFKQDHKANHRKQQTQAMGHAIGHFLACGITRLPGH